MQLLEDKCSGKAPPTTTTPAQTDVKTTEKPKVVEKTTPTTTKPNEKSRKPITTKKGNSVAVGHTVGVSILVMSLGLIASPFLG